MIEFAMCVMWFVFMMICEGIMYTGFLAGVKEFFPKHTSDEKTKMAAAFLVLLNILIIVLVVWK